MVAVPRAWLRLTACAAMLVVSNAAQAQERMASVESTVQLHMSRSYANFLQNDHKSALLMATSVEKQLSHKLGFPASKVYVSELDVEESHRKLQIGGTSTMGQLGANETRLTIKYTITCQSGVGDENQKTCADEAKNMSSRTLVASAILAGIENAAQSTGFSSKVVKVPVKEIAGSITQPHLVYIQIAGESIPTAISLVYAGWASCTAALFSLMRRPVPSRLHVL